MSMYINGLSTRQIANKVGISKSYVYKICRSISRTKSEAAILRHPPTSKHWRATRAAARKLWLRKVGPIPLGHHIHHKDNDHTNNTIENLECLSIAKHMKIHHAGPEYHIPRHFRPARKAYMKKYLKKYWKTYATKTS